MPFGSRVRPVSFRVLLVAGTVGLVVVGVGAFAALLLWQARQASVALAESTLRRDTHIVRLRVMQLLDSAVMLTDSALASAGQRTPTAAEFPGLFARLLPAFEQRPEHTFLGVGLAATGEYAMLERLADGRVRLREYVDVPGRGRRILDWWPSAGSWELAADSDWDGYDPRTRPFFLAAEAARRPVWTEVYPFLRDDGRRTIPGITLATPVVAGDGRVAAVWSADFDVFSLSDFLRSLGAGPDAVEGFAFVAEPRPGGRWEVVAHPAARNGIPPLDPDSAGRADARTVALLSVLDAAEQAGDRSYPFAVGGESYLALALRLPGEKPPWHIAVAAPDDVTVAWFAQAQSSLLPAGALAAAAALGLALLLSGALARPLERLRRATDEYARGAGPEVFPGAAGGPEECARLADSFRAMVEAIEQRRTELETANTALRREVVERERAEGEVRQLNAELEERVQRRTAQLAAANERLQEMDRLKSQFLATMSHELRTPLNSVIGFTGIVKGGLAGPVNPEQKKQLEMASSSARHLLGLINDLLDLARIESGRVEVYCEDFIAADVAREVQKVLAPQLAAKGLAFTLEDATGGRSLRTDRRKFYQILLNLAANAVKFTERGGVRLTLREAPDVIVAAVEDTGIGIRRENLGRLFEAFRQVDGSARRVYEGTGLGLHLSQQLARLLGGHITVTSEYGRGSCFTVTIPAALPASASRTPFTFPRP